MEYWKIGERYMKSDACTRIFSLFRHSDIPLFQKKGDRGFALIEMILVIILVSAGLVPIISMFLQGAVGTADADASSVASALGQEKMEATRQLAFASVTGSSGSFGSPYTAYSYTVTVGYVDGSFVGTGGTPSDYKRVDVSVSHSGSGTTYALTTVMADRS